MQEKDSLRKILSNLRAINKQFPLSKPILIKIAPDLNDQQLDDVIDLVEELGLDGIVATNTTISRNGLSNKEEAGKTGAGRVKRVTLTGTVKRSYPLHLKKSQVKRSPSSEAEEYSMEMMPKKK